jgi:hypothetical protein
LSPQRVRKEYQLGVLNYRKVEGVYVVIPDRSDFPWTTTITVQLYPHPDGQTRKVT